MPYRNDKPDVPRHRLRRVLLIVLLTPLLLCAVVAGILVLKTSAIAGYVVDRLVPVMEQRMGREVQVGTVTARLFPRPHAVVSELRIAGAPGEPELIHAGQTYVMVEPWPLVRSLGKDIRVDAIELRDTQLNLVRRADGSWNYEDVQRAIGGGSDREYVVSRFSLVNGALSWRDAARGGNATVALQKIDLTARDIGPGLPVSLDFSAALAAGGKNLSGYLRLNRLPDEADPKDAPPPTLTGQLTLKGASLERFSGLLPAQLDALASGGLVGFEAAVSTTPDGTYVLDGKAQVEALKLRGEPARGGAHLIAKVPAARPDALSVQLRDIVLQGAGVDLTGSANLALSPPAARFDLQGPLLDLNQLLALRPEQPKQSEPSEGPLVSAQMRETLADVTVTGSLALGEVRSGSLKAQDVHADVTLERGVLNVRQGRARLYGGNTRLDGTKVNLLAARPVWDLEATLEGVDLGQAVAEVSKQRPISGRVNGKLSLHGDGNDWAELRERLTGKGSLTVQEGALSADLGERIGTPLREA
ncbi:MAG TPA: AsmA family protein, partial [Myxococcaceae bacterium]|nr:AsmA family protein [Myxococcaceae bacterium]